MSTAKKISEVKFTVTLDEQNIPETLQWSATDSSSKEQKDCKSMMVFLWDTKEKNTLNINLWTKDMLKDEMHLHFYQTLISLAETFHKATGDKNILPDMMAFCNEFAKKSDVLKQTTPAASKK